MDNKEAMELFAQADSLYRRGRFGEALTTLQSLADFSPDNKTLLYAMALCLEGLDCREQAVMLCDKLVEDFSYDKAIILKARLVTKPGEPQAEVNKASWPDRFHIAAPGTPTMLAAAKGPKQAWQYWLCGFAVCCMVTIFLLSVIFFAQADTALPGAEPTLFPGRLLVFFLVAMMLVSCFTIGSFLAAERQSFRKIVGISLLCSFLMFLPIVGWFYVACILRKKIGLNGETVLAIICCVLGICLFMAVCATWALGIDGVRDIYRELEAGYG